MQKKGKRQRAERVDEGLGNKEAKGTKREAKGTKRAAEEEQKSKKQGKGNK